MKQLLRTIIDYDSPSVREALAQRASWNDAVSVQKRDESDLPDTDTRSRSAFIYRRLGHLTVNPNQARNTEALVNSYVWSCDNKPGILNKNMEEAEAFVNRLISVAKEQRELSFPNGDFDRASQGGQATRAFVLHGDRGTGKTCLLNYLLAKFSDLLDQETTVWVRVNLVANFLPNNNLTNWIAAQTTKILMRYYDENQRARRPGSSPPIAIDFVDHLQEYIFEECKDDPERVVRLKDAVTMLKKMYRDGEQEQPLSEHLVPPILAHEVMRYAREVGYSFIVVLDGLDRLDITRASKEKFDSLVNQVDTIGSAPEHQGFALVIVSRTKTLSSTNSWFGNTFRQNSPRCKTLGDVRIQEIASKRVDVITQDVHSLAHVHGWPLEDWPGHIREFGSRLDRDRWLEVLQQSLGADRRAQMQMLQVEYLQYLISDIERPYILLELLTKAGMRYPPQYYSYQKNLDGSYSGARAWEPTPLDSKFFPIIFTYPRSVDKPESPPHEHVSLAALRVLQILLTHEDLLEEPESSIRSPIRGAELARICRAAFGYQENLIYLLLEEFAEFELIALTGGLYPLPLDASAYEIHVLPKLKFFLSHVIFDIAYLNLAAMRTPVSERVLGKDNATHPYFKANCLDDKTDRLDHVTTIAGWIHTKTLNCIGLYRIIRSINGYQKHLCSDKAFVLEGRERAIFERAVRGTVHQQYGIFHFAKKMREALLAQLGGALAEFGRSRGEAALDTLVKRVVRHFEKWDRRKYEVTTTAAD